MENVSLQSVEIIINGLLKDPIAISFMMVIFGWFALAVFFVLTRIKIGSGFVAITPSSLSTLGLLGTFVGILLGLAQFKVHAINESVPILLDGMKIAFSTSVAGIVTLSVVRVFGTNGGLN
jgi:hypothetical protein